MRLLLDENISPSLVAELWRRGIDTTSIRDRGKLGLPDHAVIRCASDEDRVIVTANAADFTALCSAVELHPGLVTIESGTRHQQLAMVLAAIDHVERSSALTREAPRGFMVNRVVEVTLDLRCVDFLLPSTHG